MPTSNKKRVSRKRNPKKIKKDNLKLDHLQNLINANN